MPETISQPEPGLTRPAQAQRVLNEVVAGQSIVRTVALYASAALLVLTPIAPLAVVPLLLLLASDGRLA